MHKGGSLVMVAFLKKAEKTFRIAATMNLLILDTVPAVAQGE